MVVTQRIKPRTLPRPTAEALQAKFSSTNYAPRLRASMHARLFSSRRPRTAHRQARKGRLGVTDNSTTRGEQHTEFLSMPITTIRSPTRTAQIQVPDL